MSKEQVIYKKIWQENLATVVEYFESFLMFEHLITIIFAEKLWLDL